MPHRRTLKPLEAEYKRTALLRADLADHLSIHEPLGLLGYYLLNDSALRELAGRGDLNTDDRTVLEFSVPFSITKATSQLNLAMVRSFRKEALPTFVELDNKTAAVLAGAETQIELGMLKKQLGASLVLEGLRLPPKSERTLLLRAKAALQQGKYIPAYLYLLRANTVAPHDARSFCLLGQLYLDQGQKKLAQRALEKCLVLSPDHQKALRTLVGLEARAGRTNRALRLQQRLIAARPPQLYAEWANLGALYLSVGQTDRALEAFRKSLELEPLGYAVHQNLAKHFVRTGEIQRAIEEYRFLIQYYPTSDSDLYLKLNDLYQKVGNEKAAQLTLRKAKRIFPNSTAVEQAFY